MANDYAPSGSAWEFANICCHDLTCIKYDHKLTDSVSDIEKDYLADPSSINDIANRLRRKFELLISELAKLTLVDAHSETKDMLARLLSNTPLYLNTTQGKINRADELVSRIQDISRKVPPSKLPLRIQSLISQYDCTQDLKPVRQMLRTMKLYQKVILHQGSHSQPGMPTITAKEIGLIFSFMSTLESKVKELLANANVYRM